MSSCNSGFSSSHLKSPIETSIYQPQGMALTGVTEAHARNLKPLVLLGACGMAGIREEGTNIRRSGKGNVRQI